MRGPQLLEERRVFHEPDQLSPHELDQLARSPKKALLLSIVPGLGQIYTGETSKGVLYLIVTAASVLTIIVLSFGPELLASLQTQGLTVNENFTHIVNHARTPFNICVWTSLLLVFGLYACREAYDNARQSLQGRHFVRFYFGLPEATSGSYLVHLSVLVVLLILGIVSLVHKPEPQKTEIDFVLDPPPKEEQPPPPPPKREKRQRSQPKADIPKPREKAPAPKRVEQPKPTPAPPMPDLPKLPVVEGPAPISQPVPQSASSAGTGNQKGGGGSPNGTGGGGGDGPAQDVDLSGYLAEMERKIKEKWFPPRGNESNKITVSFKLNKRGEVSKLRLKTSSKLAISDEAAMTAVKSASPFGPLPDGSPDEVEIKFTFDYDVFSGKATIR